MTMTNDRRSLLLSPDADKNQEIINYYRPRTTTCKKMRAIQCGNKIAYAKLYQTSSGNMATETRNGSGFAAFNFCYKKTDHSGMIRAKLRKPKNTARVSLAITLHANGGKFPVGQRVALHCGPKASAIEPDSTNAIVTE